MRQISFFCTFFRTINFASKSRNFEIKRVGNIIEKLSNGMELIPNNVFYVQDLNG